MQSFGRFILPFLGMIVLAFGVLTATTRPVFAQSAPPCDPGNDLCAQDLGDVPLDPGGVVKIIVDYSVAIGGGLALILIIYGGFKMVTSSGNPGEIKKAREIITYAIIGLLLILFSVTLVTAVGSGIIPIPDIGG